jgi:YHS domain-containing protein
MDGLLTFLIFAGIFYLMMRFGCGAHMVHGHGAGHDAESADAGKHTDPVCGKEIPPTENYGKMQSGHLFRFCSRQCLDAFDADPERYVGHQKEAAQ